jgi:hypothetical protein
MGGFFEDCGHGGCEFGRDEYCRVEAEDPDGAALVVTDMLDEILYDSGRVSGDQYEFLTDGRQQRMARSFSYLSGDADTWAWPLTETALAIQHQTDKDFGAESYTVDVGWRVARKDADNEYFRTQYVIDKFAAGAVQSAMEQPDLVSGGRETSRMTGYDYEQLFDELAHVQDVFAAETRDNGLSPSSDQPG